MPSPRPNPRQHEVDRAELRRELEAPAQITYGLMPLGPEDLALLGKATGYGVNAIKALARIHAEGGIAAASGAAIQEATRIFGTGMKSLGAAAIKQRVARAFGEFGKGVERLKAGEPLSPAPRAESAVVDAKPASGKVPALSPHQEARQTMRIKSWAQDELDKMRDASPAPSRKAADVAARDAQTPPSSEALRKRLARADARVKEQLSAEDQRRMQTLQDLRKSEYKGGRSARHAMPIENPDSGEERLNRALAQHNPQPLTEDTFDRIANDPEALESFKDEGNPSRMSDVQTGRKTQQAAPFDADETGPNAMEQLAKSLKMGRKK